MIEAAIFGIDGALQDWDVSVDGALRQALPEVPAGLIPVWVDRYGERALPPGARRVEPLLELAGLPAELPLKR